MARCYSRQKNNIASKCLVLDSQKNNCMIKKKCLSSECFFEIACEQVYPNLITPVDKEYLVREPLVIELDNECLFLDKDTRLNGFHIESTGVRVLVKEGDSIEKWGAIAYTMSRKGIIRKLYVPYKGTVVLTYSDPISKPEKYIIFIDTANKVRRLKKNGS